MRRFWGPDSAEDDHLAAFTSVAPGKRTLTQHLPASAGKPDSGAPVNPAIAQQVGGMLHADLGDVRVHDDAAAHTASAELGARAFAHGHDIFLGAGESGADLGLMAHELTHVVQQGGATSHAPQAKATDGRGAGGDLEREADLVADHALRGDALDWLIGPAPNVPRVQTKRDDDGGPPANGTKPAADPATRTGFLVAKEDLFLHREVSGGQRPRDLQRTTIAIRAGMVVRGRPAPAGKAFPGFEYVVTAGELHGWAERAHLDPVPPEVVPDSDAVLGEGTPRTDLRSVDLGDYDSLAVMLKQAPLYTAPIARTDKTTQPFDTVHSMESVVYLEQQTVDGVPWQQVRLLRQAPVTGWVSRQEARRIDPTGAATGGLSGDPSLQLGSESPEVKALETQLLNLGYGPGAPDEVFDEETHGALELFQGHHKLRPDGVFGRDTAAALRSAQPVGGPRGLPTGSWRGGYELVQVTTGRALTPDGQPVAGHGPATQGGRSTMPPGPCEVLVDGGGPVSVFDPTDDVTCYYVRAAAARTHDQLHGEETANDLPLGGAGWVPASVVTGTGGGQTSPIAEELAQLCPDGITVAFVSNFDERASEQTLTFLREAAGFAAAQHAVAISGGQIVTGGVNLTTHKAEVVATLAGIQQALRGDAVEVPRWARVAHLAFFTHGWKQGLQTGRKDKDMGHLMNDGGWGDDLEGFAHTLTNFCHSDLKVSMFACSTAAEAYEGGGWSQQASVTGGEESFADDMADSLVDAGATDARVLGHTTIGHTTANYAARLYEGGEDGGRNLYNWIAEPISGWLQPEIDELTKAGGHSDPAAMVGNGAWNEFRRIIGSDDPAQIATRMNSDPELFRAELRLRIKAWMPEYFLNVLNVIPAVARIFNSAAYDINVYYLPPQPSRRGQIPAGAEVFRVDGVPSVHVSDAWHFAVTWNDDPGEKQAYMRRGFMRVVLPER